jgi:hypothetical protein
MLFCWRAVGRLISSTLQPAAFRGLGFDEDANEPLDRLLGEAADRVVHQRGSAARISRSSEHQLDGA